MKSSHAVLPLLALVPLLMALGCAKQDPGSAWKAPRADLPVQIQVENHHWDPVTVYLYRAGDRHRLGSVEANGTRVFRLPPHLMHAGSDLRFLVHPLGSRFDYLSEPLPAFAQGSVLVFRVRNNLAMSTVVVR